MSILSISVLRTCRFGKKGVVTIHREQAVNRNTTNWQFHRLTRAHHLASNMLFDKFGIREYGQPMILFALERFGKGGAIATQKELAEHLGVSQPTTAVSLKYLERQGCVSKITDERDMRRNRIEITEKGIEVAKKFREAFRELDEVMYSGFSEEEKAQAAEIYERITKNLMQHARQTSLERNETD